MPSEMEPRGVLMSVARTWAKILGGDVNGEQILCPGPPPHSAKDRSLSILVEPTAPDGFLVCSHAGDDYRDCKKYVRERLGISPQRNQYTGTARRDNYSDRKDRTKLARNLWRRRLAIEGTPAERYLRSVRGYAGPIPPTLGYLAPIKTQHHPAMIAAFGIPKEFEPDLIAITESSVKGVQLTLLKADGSGKADVPAPKLTVGHCLGTPIVLAPMNDLLGLAIVEGIEDGLSIQAATGLGVWVAGGASRMPALGTTVPAYCNCVTILIDRDNAGRKNSFKLAKGLRERGLHVENVPL